VTPIRIYQGSGYAQACSAEALKSVTNRLDEALRVAETSERIVGRAVKGDLMPGISDLAQLLVGKEAWSPYQIWRHSEDTLNADSLQHFDYLEITHLAIVTGYGERRALGKL
jgi:hypothetical protein